MSEEKWGFGNADRTKPFASAIFGNAKNGKRAPLLRGEHKHSYSENRFYMDLGGATPEEFDGHRTLIDVRIVMSNYLKESHLSGDQVRKGGSCVITADGVDVYEFFTRDTLHALQKAQRIIGELSEHASSWLMQDAREKLIGRKVWYREDPAIIERLVVDQGCVILRPDGIPHFTPPAWSRADEDYELEDRDSIKDEVLSPHIWWFRKEREAGPAAA